MLFTWQPEFELGVDSLDQQHRYLVHLINSYYQSQIDNTRSMKVNVLLEELLAYTVNHFRDEEALMAATGYPAFDEHRRQHEDLKKRVLAMQEELSRRGRAIPMRLAVFLREWLMNHLVASDRELGKFLKNERKDGDVTD